MTQKWLWILVISFSFLEWLAIPLLSIFTEHLYQVVDGILLIAFILYPIFYIGSLLFLKRGSKKAGAVILLIPLIIYAPLLLSLRQLLM